MHTFAPIFRFSGAAERVVLQFALWGREILLLCLLRKSRMGYQYLHVPNLAAHGSIPIRNIQISKTFRSIKVGKKCVSNFIAYIYFLIIRVAAVTAFTVFLQIKARLPFWRRRCQSEPNRSSAGVNPPLTCLPRPSCAEVG